jgi:hypothetical protein
MHHNLEYWDDKVWEKTLEEKSYREVSRDFVEKIDKNSKLAEKRHEENELHRYKDLMNYFIKIKEISPMKARDMTRWWGYSNRLLPVSLGS